MIAKVENIKTVPGRTGERDWTRFDVMLEGKVYSTFKPEIGGPLKEGATYDFTIYGSGKYPKIIEAKPVEGTPSPPPKQESSPASTELSRDEMIQRQTCLKAAANVMHARIIAGHELGDKTIEWWSSPNAMLKWVKGG